MTLGILLFEANHGGVIHHKMVVDYHPIFVEIALEIVDIGKIGSVVILAVSFVVEHCFELFHLLFVGRGLFLTFSFIVVLINDRFNIK